MTLLETLPSELLTGIKRLQEISPIAWGIITKVYHNEALSQEDVDYLASPSEAAALLSAKYKRPINHRYIKELTRTFVNKETGHETPPRLRAARVIGGSNAYRVEDVLKATLRTKQVRSSRS